MSHQPIDPDYPPSNTTSTRDDGTPYLLVVGAVILTGLVIVVIAGMEAISCLLESLR